MASAAICPIVGSTTQVLPPNHPAYDHSNPALVCPVTKASAHSHPSMHEHPTNSPVSNQIPMTNNAQSCPALKNANNASSLTGATCPVIGPVSAFLPADHPSTEGVEEDAVCPKTGARFRSHEGKVHQHPQVTDKTAVCPVAHRSISNA